ncbi:GntR family transcriptional regulator [Aquibium sp. LZ166]|uniref:GntR family transcriptional regulator n=1 Tax=Aquibium pacificus TaxID=3153579 RepID=A0ABV3SN79_9HYPH
MSLNKSNISRYVQLATLFRRKIEIGTWQLGQQIPTVDMLAAEFDVARATIRQALSILESDGLIERHRAKGTFVTFRPQEALWCQVETNWAGLLNAREGATIEVLARGVSTDVQGLVHQIGERAPSYLHFRRRHWRNDSPFMIGEVYIDKRLEQRITEEALRTKTSMRLIADVAGVEVTDARQTLTIGTADAEIAELLHLPFNAPVAVVHRSAIDASGTLVFVGVATYRGDVVRLDFKLR